MSGDLPNQNDPSHPGEVTPPQNPVSEVPNTPNSPPSLPNGNNTVDPVQSWVAQHEQRDSTGKFVKSDHLTNGQPSQTPSNSPNTPNPANLPPLIQTNSGTSSRDTKGDYPPLFQIANPITYLKIFWNKVMKNEGIKIGFNFTVKPVTAVMIALALTGTYAAGYHVGITDAAKIFFPNSSPLFHRPITLQGTIQKSESGQYYLSLPDNTLWNLRSTNTNINLENVLNKQVIVKGNLTAEQNVIDVKEVISFDKPNLIPVYSNPIPATNSGQPSI